MTVKNLVGTLTRGTISTATSVVRHPIGTASMAAGLVKGATGASLGLVHSVIGGSTQTTAPAAEKQEAQPEARRETQPETQTETQTETQPQAQPKTRAARPERDLPGPDLAVDEVPTIDELPEPVVIEADDDLGESFQNEPKAASRDSAHGGRPGDREEAESYAEEIPAPEDDVPVWTSESELAAELDVPLLDEGGVTAILSDAEVLRDAAESRPE